MPDLTTAPPWLGSPVVADPHEVAKWLAVTSEANRKWWFKRVEDNSDQAQHCWMADHDAQIVRLNADLTAARDRIRWLERNYTSDGRDTNCSGCSMPGDQHWDTCPNRWDGRPSL